MSSRGQGSWDRGSRGKGVSGNFDPIKTTVVTTGLTVYVTCSVEGDTGSMANLKGGRIVYKVEEGGWG